MHFHEDIIIIHQDVFFVAHQEEDEDEDISEDEVLFTPEGGLISWPTPYYNVTSEEEDEEDKQSYYVGLVKPRNLDFSNM